MRTNADLRSIKGPHSIVRNGCDWYKAKVAEPIMEVIDSLPAEYRYIIHKYGRARTVVNSYRMGIPARLVELEIVKQRIEITL